ncbi:MAG: phosphoenolpyruvate synthase [Bacillota bacterium]
MKRYALALKDAACSDVANVGGKAANLHALIAAGFNVPPGFCITTTAFREFISSAEKMTEYFAVLAKISSADQALIAALSLEICAYLQTLPLPNILVTQILAKLGKHGVNDAYAVRSSAADEDSADASFAGIYETYLNVTGEAGLLKALRDCWLSLFSERAITYRINNRFDHAQTAIAVVVQKLVLADASGVMFTADPVNNDHEAICIDANFGLGESIVSGIGNADHYRVVRGELCDKRIVAKHVFANVRDDGGVDYEEVILEKQSSQVLPDCEIVKLATLGISIREVFSNEQDIEWCWRQGEFYIVQSRPITTLFPIGQFADDRPRILFSYAHWQMMTKPISPLGCSVWRTMFPIGKNSLTSESAYMLPLAGRLYIDGTEVLYFKRLRKLLPKVITLLDSRMGAAVAAACVRERFLQSGRSKLSIVLRWAKVVLPIAGRAGLSILQSNSGSIFGRADCYRKQVSALLSKELAMATNDAHAIELIQQSAGRFEAINLAYLVTLGVVSEKCISFLMRRWSAVKVDFNVLTKAVPNDVSVEMGLALADLAEMVRENIKSGMDLEPETVAAIIRRLVVQDGKFVAALNLFLEKYGMRCSGEVDIANPRWREHSLIIAAPICNHIRCNSVNQHQTRFREGKFNAENYIAELITGLKQKRFGRLKAKALQHLLEIYRNTFGLREYPKYLMMTLFDIYRKKLLTVGENLAATNVIQNKTDVFLLSLAELAVALKTNDNERLANTIATRKAGQQNFERIRPPRVMTESGEIVMAPSKNNNQTAANILSGTAVSSGVVTGRARIVFDPNLVQLETGDILVAPYTDPGWTPLFMSASALVTEIGGLMTHGTVIAREYGLPAVTCVENATTLIREGQIIRVDGNSGLVELVG